jgi:hypothetical protein
LNKKKYRECNSATFELRDRYVYVKFKDDCNIDIAEAKIHAEHCIDLSNGEKIAFILDGLDISMRIDDDARRYWTDFEPLLNVIKATAVLANVTQTKFLARYYIKHHKTNHPVKVFSNEQDALNWIKTLP